MIHRDRSCVAEPAVLGGAAAIAERAKAVAHYQGAQPARGNMDFKVYSHPDVRSALDRLFAGKCAYCEGRHLSHPLDVEHWRPKGGIVTAEGVRLDRGYWWLASVWENLLIACIDCNRARHHEADGGDGPVLFGKENRFPLPPGAVHASSPGEELAETPLLVDPTVDDPSEFLDFVAVGEEQGALRCLASGSRGEADSENLRGRASIDVYGLNRPLLVASRSEHTQRFAWCLNQIGKALMRAIEHKPDRAGDALKEFRLEHDKLLAAYTHDDCAFSAACKAQYRSWKAGFGLPGARPVAPVHEVAPSSARSDHENGLRQPADQLESVGASAEPDDRQMHESGSSRSDP